MDMKETLRYTVSASDLDKTGYMSPCALIQQLVLASTFRNKAEGGSKGVLKQKLNAVWMFRRIKLEQYLPITEGDELVGFGSGRTDCTTEYIMRGEFTKNGELAARIDLVMMPVLLKGRRRLTCADIEPFYTTPALNEVPVFHRLPMAETFEYPIEKTITKDDCDKNAAHFAFHNYAELVCRETGYWEGEYRMLSKLQIDYVKECITGNTIKLGVAPKDAGYSVQGIHMDGKPCFNAYCEYKSLDV